MLAIFAWCKAKPLSESSGVRVGTFDRYMAIADGRCELQKLAYQSAAMSRTLLLKANTSDHQKVARADVIGPSGQTKVQIENLVLTAMVLNELETCC